MNSTTYTIATYNIRNTQDQYLKRKQGLKQAIHSLNADVIGLQEVAFSELEFLAQDYQVFKAPIQRPFPFHPDPEFRIDGNAILVRKGIKVEEHEYVHLSIFRNAQRIRISDSIHIINTHLHHVIGEDLIRSHQIDCILTFLIPFMNDKIVLLGDFNLTPDSKEYEKLEKYFKSSYKEANQVEPKITFPTGLQGPYMDKDPAGCMDYIWEKGIEVKQSKIFGDEKIEDGVYASDHIGVVSCLKI